MGYVAGMDDQVEYVKGLCWLGREFNQFRHSCINFGNISLWLPPSFSILGNAILQILESRVGDKQAVDFVRKQKARLAS